MMHILVHQYPQLQSLCWNRPEDAIVDGREALGLYERNWRFVDKDKIGPNEKELINKLVDRYGNGAFMAS